MSTISETELIQRLNSAFPGRQATELFAILNVIRDTSQSLDVADSTLTTEAGVGITAGTGTIYQTSVRKVGDLIYTNIFIDLTGLGTSTTDLDVIGVAGGPAHIGQITAAQNGTILAGSVTCLEAPATGADDIDLYFATEGTGEFDSASTALTETIAITSGAAWTSGRILGMTTVPAADSYLYLMNGEAGVVGTYTAGKLLIQLIGV